MATSEILQFAPTDTGTNLLTQAQYLAASDRTNGHQPGIASSKLENKALRQSSLIAAALAQFAANRQAANITDSLTVSAVEAILADAVQGRILGIRFFTTAGSSAYTPTTGTKRIDVTGIGGGGAGGGAISTGAGQVACGSGGGGGGWFRKVLTSGFSGATLTIGAGGASVVGGAGGAGGATSFGAVATANGGAGGTAGSPQSSATVQPLGSAGGGTATGGDINGTGGLGSYALYGSTNLSGKGGSSTLGEGPSGVTGTSGGLPGLSPGSGGSGGACGPSSGTNAGGGAGAPGAIIIVEYQ